MTDPKPRTADGFAAIREWRAEIAGEQLDAAAPDQIGNLAARYGMIRKGWDLPCIQQV